MENKNEQKLTRKSLGIKQIDSMIQGGLPNGSVIGLSGPPGVGKSIFSLHFILEGARKGEKCIYINLEEPRRNIDNMIKDFDFADEFFDLEKKELIIIKCLDYPEYEKVYTELLERIKSDQKIKRLVIDSFNCFFSSIDNPHTLATNINVRKMITDSFYTMRRNELTTLLVLEKNEGYGDGFDYNIPYLVDGMIKLDFLDLGTIERRIFIPKMRWTNQYKESKSYDIGKAGIQVIEDEELG
ncbi:MAG: AAA family ATPase [Nanoarchaeota archaeon]|nr:AAA family ATPase [Nanoarchaeota archaeon]